MRTPLIEKIENAITPTVESMGFEIVRILIIGAGKDTLQIMAERPDGSITLDECGKLSQAISVILDVENIMEDVPYFLEVGSPGLDRPLTRLKDFENYKGHEAKIEIEPAIDTRKRFKGLLQGLKEDNILITTEDGDIEIPFSSIQKAKLVISEEDLSPKKNKETKDKKLKGNRK